jgi:hypothetical protein
VSKLIVLVLSAVALLVFALPANAKGILGAQLCGPEGCATEQSAGLGEGPSGPFNGEITTPAKPGPWYRGYLLAGDHGQVAGKLPFYYVPGGNVVVLPGQGAQTAAWTKETAKLTALFESLAARVKPYPTPSFVRVTFNGRAVEDPQSYARLWTSGSKPKGYPHDLDGMQEVAFYTSSTTPWSDRNFVVFYPSGHYLVRDGQLVSLPADLAKRAARGASLDVPGTRYWFWGLVAVLVLATLAAAAAGARHLGPRLRTKPTPEPAT